MVWLRLFTLLLCLAVLRPAFADPVLVELFTSTQNCRTCKDAENGAAQLLQTFSPNQVHLLVYHINDPLQITDGFLRSKFYAVAVNASAQNPTIFFNGTTKIVGADSRVASTYRARVEEDVKKQSAGRMYSFLQKSADQWIASVTFAFPSGVNTSQLDLMLAVTQPASANQPAVVRALKSFGAVSGVTPAVWFTNAIAPPPSESANVYWYAQNRNDKSVAATSRSLNAPPEPQDFNLDGRIDHVDLFIFSQYWGTDDPAGDINKDGTTNQKDLLLLIQNKNRSG